MSAWSYVWSHIKRRKLLCGITILAVALTVALFTLMLLSRDGVEYGAQKGYGPFELVIGAEGSSSLLVLHTFYRIGSPTGNVPLALLEEVRSSSEVEMAFGVTSGDSYRGFPIVGVEPAYFPSRYDDRKLNAGRLYREPGEVVIGYAAARALNLKTGDTFTGSHGMVQAIEYDHDETNHVSNDHDDEGLAHDSDAGNDQDGHGADHHDSFIYTIVGVLPKLGTGDDRAIFTSMDHAWIVHGLDSGPREVTAIIIKPATLLGASELKNKYDELDRVQAVYTSKAVADVLNVVDSGSQLLLIVMGVCAMLAASTLLLALTSSMAEKKRDVGLLRLIGKPGRFIFMCLIGEGVALTAGGILLGSLSGRLAAWLFGDVLFEKTGIQLAPYGMATDEGGFLLFALALGVLASAIPALRVYRIDAISLFRN